MTGERRAGTLAEWEQASSSSRSSRRSTVAGSRRSLRWPGVLAYGATRDEALAKSEILALRLLADRLEHGEAIPALTGLFEAA